MPDRLVDLSNTTFYSIPQRRKLVRFLTATLVYYFLAGLYLTRVELLRVTPFKMYSINLACKCKTRVELVSRDRRAIL
jgi:hypothetical protein